MKFIVVAAQNNRSYYLAREKIGGGYTVIASFMEEQTAKETAALLNSDKDFKAKVAKLGKPEPAFRKGIHL